MTPPNEDALDAILKKLENYRMKDESKWEDSLTRPEAKAAIRLLMVNEKKPLIESYEQKVQDFAKETRRASEQHELLQEVSRWLQDRYSCPGVGSTKGDCCRFVERIDQAAKLTDPREA